jgi:hypothetical protein
MADSLELVERLVREGSPSVQEVATVASPGARAAAWAIKVKSLASYNVYNVAAVVIGEPGSLPVEIGQQVQAVNMAESFMQQGTLSAGTHAIMFRVADWNVFYAKP